jgi:hypothetical protein
VLFSCIANQVVGRYGIGDSAMHHVYVTVAAVATGPDGVLYITLRHPRDETIDLASSTVTNSLGSEAAGVRTSAKSLAQLISLQTPTTVVSVT